MYDKYCNLNLKIGLKRAKTEEERKKIKEEIKFAKMAMRKELNQEKNRNYHVDPNRPTEIIKYLEWNKSVHTNGLIKNIVLILLSVVGLSCGLTWLIPLLAYEIIGCTINFECINIQNCSICKYKKCESALQKRESKKIAHDIDNYIEAEEVIQSAIDKSDNLPTFTEIIGMIKTKEELRQMKQMLLENQELRRQENVRGKI